MRNQPQGAAPVTENRHDLQAAGMTFALVTTRSGAGVNSTARDLSKRSAQVRYFHQDHLNSIAVITDEAGQVVERLAYDPWGKRRNANGLADKNDSLVGQTTDRGYTEHEHLDEVGLIHMNGRVYDPLIGRFMSADPFIQSPGNLQSYNRYAYVMNNPLALTDPSGYFSLGSLLRSIDDFRRDLITETGKAINTVLSPLPSSLQGVAIAGVSVVVCGPGAPACAAGMTAAVTGASAYGAGASSSDALRAGAIAGGTAYAFSWAGDVYANGANPMGGYAAHAAVGCASTVASGGNCAQGAAAGVFGKYATVTIGGYFKTPPSQFNGYQMAATMVAGGVGSVIAGGKFENGAKTASFGYLFNHLYSVGVKARVPFLWGGTASVGVSVLNGQWDAGLVFQGDVIGLPNAGANLMLRAGVTGGYDTGDFDSVRGTQSLEISGQAGAVGASLSVDAKTGQVSGGSITGGLGYGASATATRTNTISVRQFWREVVQPVIDYVKK